MPFSNVDSTHSLEYFRVTTNQVVRALNFFHGNTLAVTGGITINPPSPGLHSSLNVTNGIISGNGSLLTSISPTGLSGLITTANVQNSTLTVLGVDGLTDGGTVALGGTITINLSLVNTTVNSRINLAMSANAVTTLATELLSYGSNASLRTTGLVTQANGGLEFTSYTNGQILLSNGISSRLEKNTIEQGSGVIVTNRAGSITLAANLIAGMNIGITAVGADGIQISQNTQPAASKTSLGIVSLNDTITSTSITQAASANALNAMAKLLLTTTGATKRGRLIRIDAYMDQPHLTAFNVSLSNTYTWTNPDFGNVDYIIVEVLGAGGSPGQAQGNIAGAANTYHTRWNPASGGGGGGGYIRGKITSPNATYSVVVGIGGGGQSGNVTPFDGNTGGQSIFGTNLLIANGGFGGANSRAINGNTSFQAFGNIASGVVGTRGMGGPTSNIANGVGNCQVLFAQSGGDCGDIFSVMGGRTNPNGGYINCVDARVIPSAGGSPGWPWGEGIMNGGTGGGSGGTWAASDVANNIPGVGGQGVAGSGFTVTGPTAAASNGAVIVWTYAKDQ